MTVKLALLKSGEDVIADIREAVSEETNKTVSYIFSNPYVVKLIRPQVLTEDAEATESRAYSISVYPWIPLSDDTDIAINPDWVVTIVEPEAKLKKSYEEGMNGRGKSKSNSSSSINESIEFDN